MADYSSLFAGCNVCCALANSGGVNILLCCGKKQCGCGKRRRCKSGVCRRRGKCGC